MILKQQTEPGSACEPIPDLITYIAGEFASSVMAIWGEDNVIEYLTAPAPQRHIWHAALSTSRSSLPPIAELRTWLATTKRRQIILTAFGSTPSGMINLLSKLEPRAESSTFYRAAHSALDRGDALSRKLHHSGTIERRVVFAIASLPRDEIAVKMATYALSNGDRDIDIEELMWLGNRVASFDDSVNALRMITRSNNPILALRNAIAHLPFPEPPWTASGLLPIRSAADLLAVAKRLGNCLSDHDQFYSSCVDVHNGIAFYYCMQAQSDLLLKFTKFSGLGWYLDECRGARNRRPTPQEIEHIAQAISRLDGVWRRRLGYQMR